MTFAVGHVQGGTGAGRKRPLLPKNTIPWPCECIPGVINRGLPVVNFDDAARQMNPGYLKRCIDCGTKRP